MNQILVVRVPSDQIDGKKDDEKIGLAKVLSNICQQSILKDGPEYQSSKTYTIACTVSPSCTVQHFSPIHIEEYQTNPYASSKIPKLSLIPSTLEKKWSTSDSRRTHITNRAYRNEFAAKMMIQLGIKRYRSRAAMGSATSFFSPTSPRQVQSCKIFKKLEKILSLD